MSGRSPARFAAPLALLAAALAIFLIGFSGSSDEGDNGSAAPKTSSTAAKPSAKKTATAGEAASPPDGETTPRATTGRTYTIKAGDLLPTISDETGVSVEDLERLNPGLDARALQVGRKLRLAE